MAKFRNSVIEDVEVDEPPAAGTPREAEPAAAPRSGRRTATTDRATDRAIGAIIAEQRGLSPDQIERILAYQRERGLRFGEAAIALGFASTEDVLYALSQQFHYPYAAEEQRRASPELIALNQPFSAQAEAFRAVRSQLTMRLAAEAAGERRAIAVVSPEGQDGKTFFAANLAITLAQLGGRTLVVDADLRGPRQHEVFGIDNTVGLSGVLSGRTEAKVIQPVPGVNNLYVLPVGITPPNPLELVERPAFGLLMRELLSRFEHVVVDTPAAIYGSDAAVIAARCGAALVIARQGRSRLSELQDLVATLSEGPARLAGVVMNEF
jgi:chain length determinant protein tyrosine kinase EpsG